MTSLVRHMEVSDGLAHLGFGQYLVELFVRLEVGRPMCELCVEVPAVWEELFAAELCAVEEEDRARLVSSMPEVLSYCSTARADEAAYANKYLGDAAERQAEATQAWVDAGRQAQPDAEAARQAARLTAAPEAPQLRPQLGQRQPITEPDPGPPLPPPDDLDADLAWLSLGVDEETPRHDIIMQPDEFSPPPGPPPSADYSSPPQPPAPSPPMAGYGLLPGPPPGPPAGPHPTDIAAVVSGIADATLRDDGAVSMWLEKKSPAMGKGWQRRWFVIEPHGNLRYFADPIKEVSKRQKKEGQQLPLKQCRRISSNNFDSAHFEMHFGGIFDDKTLELRCEVRFLNPFREAERAVFVRLLLRSVSI